MGARSRLPAPPPAEPLKAWIALNSMEGGTYYCAHAEAVDARVKNALAVRERFDALRRDADRLPPEEFKAAWERFLTERRRIYDAATASAAPTR